MYCVVYGHTLARERAAEFRRAKQIDYRPYRETEHYRPSRKTETDEWRIDWEIEPRSETADLPALCFMSGKFSWLPTDFEISADGKTARALGYINDLHPVAQKQCYGVIEQLVVRFLPMWERVLGEMAAGYDLPARTDDTFVRTRTKGQSYYDEMQKEKTFDHYAWFGEVVNPSLLRPFSAHPKVPTVDLNDCSLQIIVKMANICLVCLSYFPLRILGARCNVFNSDSRKSEVRGRHMARRRNGERSYSQHRYLLL